MIILRTDKGRRYTKVNKSITLEYVSYTETNSKVWLVADGERVAQYANETEAMNELERIEADIRNNIKVHAVNNEF